MPLWSDYVGATGRPEELIPAGSIKAYLLAPRTAHTDSDSDGEFKVIKVGGAEVEVAVVA